MIHAQTIDAELAAVYDVDPGRAGRLADVTRGAVANTLDDLRVCVGVPVGIGVRTANHAGHDGIEDVATVSMRFESGATADLVSVWHDILSRGSTRRVEVFCRQGMVWLDNDARGPLLVET